MNIINSNKIFGNKQIVKIFNWLTIIYFFIIALLYLYSYKYLLQITVIFAGLLLIAIIIFFLVKTKILKLTIFNITIKLFDIKKYVISFTRLWLLAPLWAFFISQSLIFVTLFEKDEAKNLFYDFIKYEIFTLQNIILTFLFYSFFILFFYALGRRIFVLFKIKFDSKIDLLLFSVSIGLIPIVFYTFGLALLGWLFSWLMWLSIIILTILLYPEIKKIITELRKIYITIRLNEKGKLLKCPVIIFLIILLTFNFLTIFKPLPVASDDLNIYFNAPNEYVNAHGFTIFPHIPHANMGQNTEMLYSAIIALLDARFIVHFQFLFFILLLVASYFLLKKLFGEKYAILGVLVAYLVPWNMYYINVNKVEMFLAFYSLMMILALFNWHQSNNKNKYLYLFGILSGIGLGIKYNAALLIIPLFLLAFIILLVKNKKKISLTIKPIFISSALLIIFFAPWAIKNQVFFSSPLYPFQTKNLISQSENSDYAEAEFTKNRFTEIRYLRHNQLEKNKNIFSALALIFNRSIGNGIELGRSINFGFIPILIFPFYFFYIRDKKIRLFLFVSSLYFVLWYYLDGSRPWYAFFGIILLYLMLPYLLLKNKKLLYSYIVIMLFVTIINTNNTAHNIYYLIGAEDKKEYIKSTVPYYETAQYINQLSLPIDKKILLLGDYRVAFINNNSKLVIPSPYLKKVGYYLPDEQSFKNYLQDNSISHIILSMNLNSYYNWLKYKNLSLDSYLLNKPVKSTSIYEDIENVKIFLASNSQLIYDDEYFYLYKLTN